VRDFAEISVRTGSWEVAFSTNPASSHETELSTAYLKEMRKAKN